MVFLLYLTALAVLQQRGPTVALRRSYSASGLSVALRRSYSLRGLTVRRTVCYKITKTVPNFSVFCLLSIVFRLLSIAFCLWPIVYRLLSIAFRLLSIAFRFLSIAFRFLSIVLCPLCPNLIRTILLRIAGVCPPPFFFVHCVRMLFRRSFFFPRWIVSAAFFYFVHCVRILFGRSFFVLQADCIRRSLFAISLFYRFFSHKNSQKHHFFAPENLHISKIFRTFASDLGDPTSLDILLTKSPDVPPP